MAPKEPKPLFDIPPEKRREAFVRARFGQDDVFAGPNIEEWLARQREAEKPVERIWRRLIDRKLRLTAPFDITQLPRLACPQNTPPNFFLVQKDAEDPLYGVLRESVDRRRVDVLPVNSWLTLCVLRVNGIPSRAFAITPQPVSSSRGANAGWQTLRPAKDDDFLQAILSRGWSVGTKKIAEAARAFLCDALAEEVKRERAKAEADFDTAVAVSADGTKIVHADWVVVHCGIATRGSALYDEEVRDRFLIFRSEWFRSHKARRPDDISRTNADARGLLEKGVTAKTITPNEIAAIVARNVRGRAPYIRGTDDALLLTCNVNGAEVRIYCTTADLCPSPLPDGGVEVTV